MQPIPRLEDALIAVIEPGERDGCPPGLAAAIRYAVFPGGARVRPRLCLAVAEACREDEPAVVDGAAVAIELLHCASLIHDDLPCFDNAQTRRGKPSVHRAFGERLAVLGGDAMIVLAFEALARGCQSAAPDRLPTLLGIVARAVGTGGGIVAGQAWECEPSTPLARYQRAKTGSLFVAATMAGAAAAGFPSPSAWQRLGECIGDAYQVADDILDVVGDSAELGKPVGQDSTLGRPSAVAQLGLDGAVRSLHALIAEATGSIPDVGGGDALRALIRAQAERLLPAQMRRAA